MGIRGEPSRAVIGALALLAAIAFAYPCLRVFAGFEVDYNEGWNAWLQALAMTGASPYGGAGPLFFNNYPPLSFYLVGALGLALGDPTMAGRALSCLALAVIAASCATVTRKGGGSRLDAWLAAATCVGLFTAFAADYVGSNDPQLLAQGFLTAGFAIYAGGKATPKRMVAVALLFAAGVLCKHNVIVLPVVVTLHALIRAPGPARWTYLGMGIALAGASGLAIHLLFGPDFFRLLLAPRTYDVTRGFILSQEVLGHLQAPLGVAVLFLALTRATSLKVKVAAYLAGGLGLGMVFSGGAGVDLNIYFDVMVASSMAVGLASAWVRQHAQLPRSGPAILAILANFGVILVMPQTFGRMAVDFGGDWAEREALTREDEAALRAIPGPALCESMLLCLKAGKGVAVDPYNLYQATVTGRLPKDQLTGMLRRQDFAVVQIKSVREHPVPEHPATQAPPQRFVNFDDAVFDALDQFYELKRVGLSGRFYTPKPLPQRAP